MDVIQKYQGCIYAWFFHVPMAAGIGMLQRYSSLCPKQHGWLLSLNIIISGLSIRYAPLSQNINVWTYFTFIMEITPSIISLLNSFTRTKKCINIRFVLNNMAWLFLQFISQIWLFYYNCIAETIMKLILLDSSNVNVS